MLVRQHTPPSQPCHPALHSSIQPSVSLTGQWASQGSVHAAATAAPWGFPVVTEAKALGGVVGGQRGQWEE